MDSWLNHEEHEKTSMINAMTAFEIVNREINLREIISELLILGT